MTLDRRPCAHCGHANRTGARLCARCGLPLVRPCRRCRQDNRPAALFCRTCGAPLDPDAHSGSAGAAGVDSNGATAAKTPLLNRRYHIESLLAHGGMGSVYTVRDVQQPGTVWALKEIDLAAIDPVEQQDAIADFRREATLLRTLNHPHLVKVIDHFSAGQKEYLVMQQVRGATLEALLRQRPAGEAEALSVALQLCDVLGYLHGCTPPIIYRDLKPSNIMVETATGCVKLIDFGIARFYKPGKQKDTKMMGTPGFAPPEQYGRGQTDARSDVFALGVTLHVMLTGYDVEQSPWSYPPVTALNPQASPAVERIVARATQMQVARRYQTVAALRADLLGCRRMGAGARSPAGR